MTHYDILPPEQLALLPKLSPTGALGYTLYGGTAVALQIGHRESIDFDFFTDKPLDEKRLVASMPLLKDATTTQREADTWTMMVRPDGMDRVVKLSFFGGLGFGRVGSPTLTGRGELAVASLDDLMGHKLKVLLQRVEAKDYQDISAMLVAGQSLERGLGAAKALFDNFPPAEAVRTMTYFDGGDLARLTARDRQTLTRAAGAVGHPIDMPILSRSLAGPPPAGQGGMPPPDHDRGR